jgi:hypothetical protein
VTARTVSPFSAIADDQDTIEPEPNARPRQANSFRLASARSLRMRCPVSDFDLCVAMTAV